MKLFVKLMLLILVIALAGPFFIKGPDGRPLMTTAGVKREFRAATAAVGRGWDRLTRETKGLVIEDGDKTIVYRWRDDSGGWHYSDSPNPDGGSERVVIDPDNNLLQAHPPDAPTATQLPDEPEASGLQLPSPFSVTPGEIPQLIEDTHGVREQLEERDRDIDAKSREN